MSSKPEDEANEGQMLLYCTPSGSVRVEVAFRGETAWLSPRSLAALFGVQVPAVNEHLRSIFAGREMAEGSVVSVLETTGVDEKRYRTKLNNLDAIIAVGYRVNSREATQFRISEPGVLREWMVKALVLDDERWKRGKHTARSSA